MRMNSRDDMGSLNGVPLEFFPTSKGTFCLPHAKGGETIRLIHSAGWEGARVAPSSLGISPGIRGAEMEFELADSRPLLIETPGRQMIYILPVDTMGGDPPTPQGGRLLRFTAGCVHDAGEIRLGDGDVLWIDAGAWVRGHVIATRARNIVIGGRGVLDGGGVTGNGLPVRPILLDHCAGVRISGITMINPQHWMITVGGCEDVHIEGVRQIGDGASTDGIDIVGSRRVHITDCFLRNGDDNIAIKALDVRGNASACQISGGEFCGDWTGPVEDVLVERCAFYNDRGGTAMEIGYETRTDRISNITFRDIDVMAVHQFGSVFGIHNGDRALVENVLWENIRVDHHYDKLVDFRVLHSRWNRDSERGRVRNITLRGIRALSSIYNEGYTVSLIGGYDEAHQIEGVSFEDFFLGGNPVRSGDAMDLFTRHANGIRFS